MALQFQALAISHETQEKWSDVESGKEDFFDHARDCVAECPIREVSKLTVDIAILDRSTLEVSNEVQEQRGDETSVSPFEW